MEACLFASYRPAKLLKKTRSVTAYQYSTCTSLAMRNFPSFEPVQAAELEALLAIFGDQKTRKHTHVVLSVAIWRS